MSVQIIHTAVLLLHADPVIVRGNCGSEGSWTAVFPLPAVGGVASYDYYALEARGALNDQASSFFVPQGVYIEIYQDNPFQGQKWTIVGPGFFNACAMDLSINDKMSSMKIYRPRKCHYGCYAQRLPAHAHDIFEIRSI